ncbi:hypothetical protein GX865_02055 [Candidatus Saccharibacteria bacterium]|nr:hypothetical protein [Candidatus Saccharibacteria bacterium]
MKKITLLAITIILLIIMFVESGVTNAMLAFLLVGALPGTTYSLPPGTMLIIIVLTIWLLTLRATALPLISFLRVDHMARKYLQQKNNLPKKRFGQI